MPASFKKLLLFLTLIFAAGALVLSVMIWMNAVAPGSGRAFGTAMLAVGALVCVGWCILASVCIRSLIGLYREELQECTGQWHLSLAELLIASLVTGMLMLAAQSFCTREALPFGIAAAILLGLYFTGDLLISARKGNNAAALKTVASIGTVLKVVGWLAFAVALFKTSEHDFVNRMLFFYGKSLPESTEASVLNLLRFGLLCLPTGFLLAAFSAQFTTLPPQTEGAPTETLRKLLDIKSGIKRSVDNEENEVPISTTVTQRTLRSRALNQIR